MTLQNPLSVTFGGEPVVGVVPAKLIVHGELSRMQAGFVQARFAQFCTATRLSIAPSMTLHYTLPDGSKMRASSIFGVKSVQVWPVADGGEESSGIGMRFIGWDDQPIPRIAGYWLVFFRAGKWWAQTRENLVGASTLWVNAGRSGWIATRNKGAGLAAYSRNRKVASITSPPPDVYPAIFVAAKREHSASGVSLLKMDDGVARLYQKSDDGEEFVEADNISVEPGGGFVLGIAGNHAVIATATAAHRVALSPELAIAGVSGFPILPAPSFSSSGDISYVGNKTFTPNNGPSEIEYLFDLSTAPNIGERTLIREDGNSIGDQASRYKEELFDSGLIGFRMIGYEWTFAIGNDGTELDILSSATYGVWTTAVAFERKTNGPGVTTSDCTYGESLSTSESSSTLIERGIRHDGSVWQISKTTSIEKSIDGVTVFDLMSSTVSKDCSWHSTDTWTLPSFSISSSITVSEAFSESVNVPLPEIYPVDGSTSVGSSISKERLHLQHYDPDMDCTVFIKESVSAGGVTSWEKNSDDVIGVWQAHTPSGDYFYHLSDPVSTVAGTANLSVCVYLGAELAYEELLESGPATGGSTQYEPKAYPDMRFSFAANTPKPTGTYWPEQEIVYGPSAPFTAFRTEDEEYMYGGKLMWTPITTYIDTFPIEREWSVDRVDTLDGMDFQLYPADASGAPSAHTSTAKDAASGALAIEIHYTSTEFPEPSRSRILLVSPGKVTKLTDLIKVTDPENHGEFITKFKTNNFLVTV